MKSILIAILLLSPDALSYAQTKHAAQMSVQEAKQFAIAAISPETKRMRGFQLIPDNSAYKGLYVFNAIWEGLPGGSMEIGFYAVDPITGTVWNAVTECDQLSSPELSRLQLKRREQSGYSKIQFGKLQAKGPQCPTN